MRLSRFLLVAFVVAAGSGILSGAEIAGPAESSSPQCCNPEDEPTNCTTGATCCGQTNRWACNDAEGVPTCEEAEHVCGCGGISGKRCPDSSYCDYLGDTCLGVDASGVCVPFPLECPPSSCSPVCSCSGNSYTHVCEAEIIAQDAFGRHGFCDEIADVIFSIGFVELPAMRWAEDPAALYYNIYKKERTPSSGPLTDAGTCFFTGLTSAGKIFLEEPEPGTVWLLQVTSTHFLFREQRMGMTSDCTFREPAERCDQP